MSYIARNIAHTAIFKQMSFYSSTHVFNNLYLTILQWISFSGQYLSCWAQQLSNSVTGRLSALLKHTKNIAVTVDVVFLLKEETFLLFFI